MALGNIESLKVGPSDKVSQEARAKGGGLRSKGDGFPGQPPNMKQGTDNLTKAGGA